MTMQKILTALTGLETLRNDFASNQTLADKIMELQKSFLMEASSCLTTTGDLTYEEQQIASRRDARLGTVGCGRISAIKAVKERLHIGLKEAKDMVDKWMDKNLGTNYCS